MWFDFPEQWVFGWEVINFDPFFSAINIAVLRGILVPLEKLLLWFPWWVVIIVVGLIGWRIVSAKFAGIAMGFLVLMTVMGLVDFAMMNLGSHPYGNAAVRGPRTAPGDYRRQKRPH